MPPTKKTKNDGKMDARVAVLENELESVKTSMAEMRAQLEENHSQIIAKLTKKFGEETTVEDEVDAEEVEDNGKREKIESSKKGTPTKSASKSELKKLEGGPLEEFR